MSHDIETIREHAAHERIIRPRKGLIPIDFPELWRYRELLLMLAWRNILVRYKQTYLGILWAVIQPLMIMVVMTIVFGKIAKMPDGGAPYPVLTFAAVLPWQFFGAALTGGSGSLVNSQSLITKIYFPRLLLPISSVLSGSLDFLVSLAMLAGLMVWYDVPFTLNLLALPLFFLLVFAAALSLSLWLGALSVRYRDVSHIVPFIVRFGLYASPVGFLSASLVPDLLTQDQLVWYHTLNPMVGILEGFRWCILGTNFTPLWPGLWAGTAVIAAVLVSGAYFFRLVEKTFADVI
ncbi:MAG: ABC transporter permease [Verrucomicrobiia bacterium]|jgi:lipopolysaccharide transport system permease protein